jgi:hypothetical protein
MRRWPWITLVLVAVVMLTPFGRDFVYSAFFSGEQLSRNIAQPIVFSGFAIALLLAALEWWIRRVISKRRVET